MTSTLEINERQSTPRMVVNIGPQHPATHGTFRIECVLEGLRGKHPANDEGFLDHA